MNVVYLGYSGKAADIFEIQTTCVMIVVLLCDQLTMCRFVNIPEHSSTVLFNFSIMQPTYSNLKTSKVISIRFYKRSNFFSCFQFPRTERVQRIHVGQIIILAETGYKTKY